MRARVLPASFAEATVCCIPKTAAPATGLDFRPIALLNGDYKIYSRLLLNRVRDTLPTTLSQTQFGFAPGRQVHDAIDVWYAIKRRVQDGACPTSTTAVLLDFAKAYDTLDRTFLSAALHRHGYPEPFVHAISDMHLATTAKFLAGGELSDEIAIHNGIRQGCPLAPVLFVLAIDLLYEAARCEPGLPGVQLDDRVRVVLAGNADDTNAYLSHPAEEKALLQLLDDFGAASGLRVNRSKCMAVSCSTAGPSQAHRTMVLPVLPADRHHRLLGVQIASDPSAAHIWSLTLQQLRATLHLAALKTTDVLQRAQICAAIVIPKLTFVGRHSWPTADVLETLQRFVHNYVWGGSVAAATKPCRAWLRADVATLRLKDGGVGEPDVRAAFLRLSEKVATRRAAADSPVAAAVGAILLRQAPTHAPHRSEGITRIQPAAARVNPTLAATGLAQIRHRFALLRRPDETEATHRLLQHAGRGGPRAYRWEDGWIHCDYTRHRKPIRDLLDIQRRWYGDLSVTCLLATAAAGAGVLLMPSGADLQRHDFSGLVSAGDRIDDIVDVAWAGDLQTRFHYKKEAFPLRPRIAEQFRLFCDVLVFNYPAILLPHSPVEYLQPRPPTEVRQLPTVTSKKTAARAAREAGQAVATFDPHPWLEPFASIWNLSSPQAWSSTTRQAPSPAVQHVLDREQQGRDADAAIGGALSSLSWKRIAHLQASASSQRLLLHKIKGQRLSGWSRHLGVRGCPHCAHAGPDGGHTFHIVWHCEAAQTMWRLLLRLWQRLGLWRHCPDRLPPSFLTAVFKVRLPATPVGAVPLAQAPGVSIEWKPFIWTWRNGLDDDDFPWTGPVAAAALRTRLLDALHAAAVSIQPAQPHGHVLRRLLTACRRLLLDNAIADAPRSAPDDAYVLFFDGGSRGNPGPGGAGAIVVRTTSLRESPQLVWSGAMSHAAASTTNNRAEYLGLVTGLAAADRHQWRPLDVVGDSQLIIRQMRHYRPPKSGRLLPLYQAARRLADKIGVEGWHHHLRAYNRMADTAANVAMDRQHSIQSFHPTPRPEWAGLGQHLLGDFLHWRSTSCDRR